MKTLARLLILLFIGLTAPIYLQACCGGGCGLEKTPLSEEHLVFVGSWSGDDGTSLVIRADGGGDLKIKRSTSKELSGGSVVFEGETLKIELLGMKQVFTIDEAPEEGGSSMILSGEKFTRD